MDVSITQKYASVFIFINARSKLSLRPQIYLLEKLCDVSFLDKKA